MDPVTVLVVDDEPPARRKLRHLLAGDPEVSVVGEAGSAREAAARIEVLDPELVFLDVQMPDGDGFAVLSALAAEERPEVVFVTAYDAHALRAFDESAVDYLLKPYDRARFARALERGKARVRERRAGPAHDRLRALLDAVRAPAYERRLLVRGGARSFYLDVTAIDWIEAARNYVRVHVGRDAHLLRASLSDLERRLDPAAFARIHRTRLVNIARIRELRPWSHADLVAVLHDGTQLLVSRRYRGRLPGLG